MGRPLIGITAAPRTQDGYSFYATYTPIVHAVDRAGGLPIMLAAGLQPDALRALYQHMDGILLPGGGDVEPACYHSPKHPLTRHISTLRDEMEFTLARWAVEEDVPILGICRGHQVFNVAMGGTLIQDIPSQYTTTLDHFMDTPRDHRAHEVYIEPDSRLAGIIGSTSLLVNSRHHQAIETITPQAKISAHAPDGIIEGIEIPTHRFAVCVQWHPEDLIADAVMLGIFRALVDAARKS